MDSISRPEFAKIFIRVSSMVDLQGATTAVEIENRLDLASYLFRKRAQSLRMTGQLRKQLRLELGKKAGAFDRQITLLKAGINRALAAQSMYHAEQLNKLVEHDFAGRAIYEANRNPRGMIAQTLIYGSEVADYRILAHGRAQARLRRLSAEARARRREWIRKAGG